jgi:gliding motility-associated-like protein
VTITSINGCVSYDSVIVDVFYDPPIPILSDTVFMCLGSNVTVTAAGGDSYVWSPNSYINTTSGPTVVLNPPSDRWYICDFYNACGSAVDSVFVDVRNATINACADTIICPGQTATLSATGGVSYVWSPNQFLDTPNGSSVLSTPPVATLYTVLGIDANGCTDTSDVFVDLFSQPFIQTIPDVYAIYGDAIQLGVTGNSAGSFIWSPAEYLSCVSCTSPIATVSENMTFTVTYFDENGCSTSDNINIFFDPIIYIPNTFTPDDDEFNQGFRVFANNIESFELLIFNRWGELVYSMNDLSDYWDGSYNGNICQDGTYTWKMTYHDFDGDEFVLTGHVNLLR